MRKTPPKYKRIGHDNYEHRLIAEKILGRPLKSNEVVHHINSDGRDNRHENLVICTKAYHTWIHLRERALDGCGNPNFRKCYICGKWSDPSNMKHNGTRSFIHIECANARKKVYFQRHRDKVLAKRRAYVTANKTEVRARARKRHAERMASDPAYHERVREQWRLADQRRRERLRGLNDSA